MDTQMKYAVVTTFNASGYERYASRMIDTFLQNWPKEIDLYVYTEDCAIHKAHQICMLEIYMQ
jgi:hypothetical protein